MASHAIPFLERMHSEKALLSALQESHPGPPEVLYTAILMSRLGRQADACATLAAYSSTGFGAWVDRARELATELGCG